MLTDAGYWILDAGCWMLDARCWMPDTLDTSTNRQENRTLMTRIWRMYTDLFIHFMGEKIKTNNVRKISFYQ
jgi:hypothetical protein